jgi:uncharacterized membrane protein
MRKIFRNSIIVGIILGVISAFTFLSHSSFALLPWGLGAMFVGHYSRDQWEGRRAGGLYGLFLMLGFLLAGYRGTFELRQLMGFFVLCFIVVVIGTLCGALLASLAISMRELYNKSRM